MTIERKSANSASSPGSWTPPSAKSRKHWVLIGAGAVVLLVGVVGVISQGVGEVSSSGLPPGTQMFPETNHQHVAGPVHYNRNPPAGGPHNPVWLNCGIYNSPVPNTYAVHSLEHGTVWLTYRPSLAIGQVKLLQELAISLYDRPQRYIIVSPYPGLPAPIVASAWGAQLKVSNVSSPGLAAFIRHFVGGAQGQEPGAPCTGGVGQPIR